MKPFKTSSRVASSKIDTRSFFPQIGAPSSFTRAEEHENPPTPLWNLIDGEPNSLLAGEAQSYPRISAGKLFPGIGATGWDPPDPTIAVGPNHIVETANSRIAFYNKSGTQQFAQDAANFFTGIRSTNFQFDPRVIYDRIAQRWLIIFDDLSEASNISKMLVAISDDADPNGTWFRYNIEAKIVTTGATAWQYWLDYPGFGYSKDGYVISGNMFAMNTPPAGTPTFIGVQFIVLPKAPMLTGASVTPSYLRDPNTGTAQMGDSFDPVTGNVYGVCRLNSTSIRIYAVGSITGTPTLNFTNVTVPSQSPPAALAPSTPSSLDTLDGRIMAATWRSGHLFASHTIRVGATTVNQVRWYDVNLNNYPVGTPTLAQSGNVAPPTGSHFHMPAVASNGYNDVSVIFTRSASSGAGAPADSMSAGRRSTDAAGTMGAPVLLQASFGPSYSTAGGQRWGDYFQAVVDPTDDATFWGVAVVASPTGGWQTVINSWTVTPPAILSNNTLAASTVQGGATLTGTVTLDSPAPQYGYVVSLSSSDTSAATVPPTVTVPGGATSVNYTLQSNVVTVDKPVTVIATLRGVSKNASTTVLAPRLKGTVTLGDFGGTVAGQPVTIQVRLPGSPVALDTYSTTLDASGNFSVITTRSGTFDVSIQGSHWLRKVVANVTFNSAGASGVNATLTNGDVNGDNAVTLGDFAALRLAFGSTSSSSNWNPGADLNGDGAVTLGDFAILRSKFGQTGDV